MTSFEPKLTDYELGPDGRPDFLVKLGVLLPCTPEDVKQAYLAKVRSAHPDVGGTQEDFLAIQQAFDRATEYAHFIAGRRKWLGAQVERYIAQEDALSYVRSSGGRVLYDHKEWLSREIGEDFAQVLDTVSGLLWTGPTVNDEHLDWLGGQREVFSMLRVLDLSDSRISDVGAESLAAFTSLEKLILRNTPVTHQSLKLMESLSNLNELDVRDTKIGAVRLYFVRRSYPDVEIHH